jgi:prepilin-type N-terminal cleavage/methylation domain-containing protein
MHSKDIMKAKKHLSQNKSRGGFTLVEILVVIGMIATLAGISFPVYRGIQKKMDKQSLSMGMQAITRAVDNFETEYNYLPYIGTSYPTTTADRLDDMGHVLKEEDGDFSDFISMLMGLPNNTCNFKKIKFFEFKEASGGPGNYKDGLHISGTTATLYDLWGQQHRRVYLDYNLDGQIPFLLDKNNVSLSILGKKCYVFSRGEDGTSIGASWTTQSVNRDNVYSFTDNVYKWAGL